MHNISKDSLWAAFERYNECGQHSYEECVILNNLYNMALSIERGKSVDDAMRELREIAPLDKNETT